MDISYLLWLQDFRNGIHDALTPFLEGLSFFSISYLFFIPIFIYWCVDKRKGLFTLAAFLTAIAVNTLIKLTACVYRPWIKNPLIIPAGNAITTATGYSFPSGHSIYASTLYGGTAIGFWNNKYTRILSWICIIFCILTGFSRNYLGVHTPQDVVVGFMVGSLVLWGMYKLVNYLSVHPEKENYFLLAGVLLGIFGLIYVNYKPYPMDYVDGKLLVDPQKMLNDAYLDLGGLSIFCITRFIEKKWIGFKSTGLSLKGILVSLAGLVCLVLLMKLTMNWFISHLGFKLGSLAIKSVLLLFAIDIYPLCIKYIMKQS